MPAFQFHMEYLGKKAFDLQLSTQFFSQTSITLLFILIDRFMYILSASEGLKLSSCFVLLWKQKSSRALARSEPLTFRACQ